MAQRRSARQRLIQAAFELFSTQGVGVTTTRQVAEQADVNEVTLFRQFGSKQGLLLAVVQETAAWDQLAETLASTASAPDLHQAVAAVLAQYWHTLAQHPDLVRAVIGEGGQFSSESRQALGHTVQQVQQATTTYLRGCLPPTVAAEPMARQLTVLLLGYAALELTTERHELWPNAEAFQTEAVTWLVGPPAPPTSSPVPNTTITDLPAPTVRTILQQARKQDLQIYALVYLLFGAGLTAEEAADLQRVSAVYDSQQHIVQVGHPARQVPLNQWIMGHRYGSYANNPLTKWLKARKDDCPALFVLPDGHGTVQRLTPFQIRQLWQTVTSQVLTPAGIPPVVEQARQTWCVDMLMRGLDVSALSHLTGLTPEALQPCVQRAEAKATLERALQLDRQPTGDYGKLDTGDQADKTAG